MKRFLIRTKLRDAKVFDVPKLIDAEDQKHAVRLTVEGWQQAAFPVTLEIWDVGPSSIFRADKVVTIAEVPGIGEEGGHG